MKKQDRKPLAREMRCSIGLAVALLGSLAGGATGVAQAADMEGATGVAQAAETENATGFGQTVETEGATGVGQTVDTEGSTGAAQTVDTGGTTGMTQAAEAESASAGETPAAAEGPGNGLTLGLAVGGGPRYMGSDEYKVGGGPYISARYAPFFLEVGRGIGVEHATDFGLMLSASVDYDPGRWDRDKDGQGGPVPGSDRLAGMGRIKGGAVARLMASQQINSWLSVDANAELRVSGQKNRGNQYQLGLNFVPYASDSDVFKLGVGARLGDADFNQTFFGVTPEQSSNSRFASFTAESGLYAYSISADWQHRFDEHWSSLAKVEAMQFASKIKKSPIIESNNQVMGMIGVAYEF